MSAFCGKGNKSAWEVWSSYTEVTQAFNYMAASRHSPLTMDGHTSKFWSVTQSSFTTRRAIRVLSMKCGESCSARRTKRWNTSHQLKIPWCSTQNVLPNSLEYERHVNLPISRHPVQKDVDGHWMETARCGVLFGALCRWIRKPALNWASVAAAEAQVVVVEGACVRRQTRNAQSLAVVNVTDNCIIHECWNKIGNSNIRGHDVKDQVRKTSPQ